ncbi:hypothetical protein AQ505_18385 [Pedobacter sp. PACM 27299]|uniref:hypothetical protein n=1 Tax=Pedobacter sp. PACM 27299 TaxID=1727164 RepID=UPI000706A5F7|nr:hypothetical protein [Pedobacter sp. PACM 27299]ALL07280.1 hypothetical protein AQ505_18385 [Pedobacter sp. PACM 27299]
MLIKPTAILLLFSLLTVNFANAFVFAGFEMNQRYIAAELCVNKDKPQLQCNGKCYLMKKLKQAQDKEQKQERQAQKTQIQDALVVNPFVFKQYAFAEITLHVPVSTGMPQELLNAIFHPPQFPV